MRQASAQTPARVTSIRASSEKQNPDDKASKPSKKSSTPSKGFGKIQPAAAVPVRRKDPTGPKRDPPSRKGDAPLSTEEAARLADILAAIKRGPVGPGMADLERLVASSPNQPRILKVYGLLLCMQDRLGEALPVLDRVQALGSQLADEELLARGTARRKVGRLEEALADFTAALRLAPNNARALSRRGETQLQLDRPHKALADLERAVTLRPDDVVLLVNRGAAKQALGKLKEGLADVERAYALEPTNMEVLHHRGVAKMAAKDFPGAVADLDVVLAQNPSDAVSAAARGPRKAGNGQCRRGAGGSEPSRRAGTPCCGVALSLRSGKR
jgi:tetratricopeptide (TPR) repeat protein